jgi:hypothetical protein
MVTQNSDLTFPNTPQWEYLDDEAALESWESNLEVGVILFLITYMGGARRYEPTKNLSFQQSQDPVFMRSKKELADNQKWVKGGQARIPFAFSHSKALAIASGCEHDQHQNDNWCVNLRAHFVEFRCA